MDTSFGHQCFMCELKYEIDKIIVESHFRNFQKKKSNVDNDSREPSAPQFAVCSLCFMYSLN